jgi:P27 family predicted phage terminase small subunit
MTGGRVELPTKLKRARGVTRTRINAVEPEPPEALPVPPSWLSAPVRDIFLRTVEDLDAMGLASRADTPSLVTFAQACYEHQRASILIEKQGLILIGREGQPIRNPAAVITNQTATVILRLSERFGLTPASRAQMGTKNKPLKDGDKPERLLA